VQDQIERSVRAEIAHLLGLEDVPVAMDLSELGMSSALVLLLHTRLNAEYGYIVDLVDLFVAESVRDVIVSVRRKNVP
jgi:acyl carrier protein